MKVIVYSTEICPNCRTLKDLLKSMNISFQEISLNNPTTMTDLAMNGIFPMMAPILRVNDKFYNNEIIENGKLNASKVINLLKINT